MVKSFEGDEAPSVEMTTCLLSLSPIPPSRIEESISDACVSALPLLMYALHKAYTYGPFYGRLGEINLEWTSIRISKDLKEQLARVGSFGESYEAVIRRLLEFYYDQHKDKRKETRK